MISLVAFIVVAAIFIGIGLFKFAKGADGSFSLTNTQMILWSGLIIASYVAMAILEGDFLDEVPANLILLMGISLGSGVAAKTIRTIQDPNGKKKTTQPSVRDLFTSENNPLKLSIPKMQMMAWTIVTLLIFLYLVLSNIYNNNPVLPDVESGLVGLMGISHGAYNANKISDNPQDENVPFWKS